MPDTLPPRFLSKVRHCDDGCWEWTAATSDGYGLYWHDRRLVSAHRYAYQTLIGSIPDDLELDHECERRACVNPLHLRAVTHTVNLSRRFAKITACPKGHAYSPSNMLITRRADGTINRRCRACKADYWHRTWLKNRRAAKAASAAPSLFVQES